MWTIIFFTSWQRSSFVMGNDDWPRHLSNEIQLKCQKRPPKSSKNEMLVFGLHSTSGDRPSNPSNERQPKCDKRPPKSSKNEIFIFINYIQLLVISQAIRVMKVDQNAKKKDMLFQSGSSVLSVWVFCMHPPTPGGKVEIRVTEKFRFFRFMFNKLQPKDNSVQTLPHLLAMQLICDGQCTNWFTLHFYYL